MDIGTNTELIVGNKHRILAASCPAGPAFEGGAIACGMPALDGAIESVAVADDGAFRLGVIGDVPPQGICGSGLIDTLSELLRTDRMNDMGRFEDGFQRITLYHSESPGQDKNIFLLESDVNELAQAKGATLRVCTRLQHVWHRLRRYRSLLSGGGFGRHLNVEASKRIGLVPSLTSSKIVQAGNTAIEGATIALLSKVEAAGIGRHGEAGRTLPALKPIRTSSISLSRAASSSPWSPFHARSNRSHGTGQHAFRSKCAPRGICAPAWLSTRLGSRRQGLKN